MKCFPIVALLAFVSLPALAGAEALIVTPNYFNATLPHGSNYSNHFRVTPQNVSINATLSVTSPFQVNLSQTLLDLVTYQDIDFNIKIPDKFLEGIYQSYIFVNAGNETKFVTVEIIVQGQKRYESPQNISITTPSGVANFFVANLKNTGNSIVRIAFNTSAGIGNLTTPTTFIDLYPGVTFGVPFTYIVDEDTVPDQYQVNIYLITPNETRIVPVLINVTDRTPPEVIDGGFVGENNREIEAGKEYMFWTQCTDNMEVKEAFLTVVSEDDNETYGLAEDGDRWTVNITLQRIGELQLISTCKDIYGNEGSKTFYRKGLPVQGCTIGDFDFHSIKKDTKISRLILDCIHKVPVSVTLTNFEFDSGVFYNESNNETAPEVNYAIYVDDNSEKYDLEEGEKLELEDVEQLYLNLQVDQPGFYEGEVMLSFPEWVHDDEPIYLSGKVDDMTLAARYFDVVGDGILDCRANTTDEFRESFWDCIIQYPIDTPMELLAKPMTPTRYKEIEHMCDYDKQALNETVNKTRVERDNAWAIVFVTVALGIACFIFPNFVYKRYKEHLRLKWR
jgi:hypothetical protein